MQMCLSLKILQLSPPTCGSFLDSRLRTLSAFSAVELPRVFVHRDSEAENKKRQAVQRFGGEAQLNGAFALSLRGKARRLRGFFGGGGGERKLLPSRV